LSNVRFIFKTSYHQDLGLFQDRQERNWYLVLALGLLLTPFVLPAYLGDLSLMLIFGLCGVSLMVLVGYTGLVSLGHAAFLGIGAYTHVYFSQDLALPWVASVMLAAAVTAIAGALVGLPVLRLSGLYLGIATLAFALIIQEIFSRWDSVTGGIKGKAVERAVIFGYAIHEVTFYFLCLGFLLAVLWFTRNLLRAPAGRALIAIRDSELAAQSMGVNLTFYKTFAFAYSAAIMGFAGALFAHEVGFLAPDIFTALLSIQFLLMVVVGGLGSLHGAVFGAMFTALLPVVISSVRDSLPDWLGGAFGFFGTDASSAISAAVDRIVKQPGLEPGILGLMLVLFILFEPRGIYGRWLKIRLYFSQFPLYQRPTFTQKKSYMKSERFR
jgi:branched-chain amino acid transport system permease protein